MAPATPGREDIVQPSVEPVPAPQASIIIPTHNRRELLEKALERLGQQTVDMSTLEVIVAADGCDDGTADAIRFRKWPFTLRVLAHPRQGSAASRNAAAGTAIGPVLVFLDDDVMAAPDLVEKHLAAHADGAPTAAIGRLLPASNGDVPSCWRWLERQLESQYQALLSGKRPIDGVCLYSGNCSINREAFLKAGGFNEKLEHAEDVELGMRLKKAGVNFRLALDAGAEHWGYRSYGPWRAMAYDHGVWDAGLIFKGGAFPSGLERLRAEFAFRSRLRRRFTREALKSDRRLDRAARALRSAGIVFGFLRMSALERKAYGAIYDLTYWKGVSDTLGGMRPIMSKAREEA
jgi:GT2 family glycosyltransferase